MQAQNIDARSLIKLLYKEEEIDKETAEQVFAEHKKSGINIVDACLEAGVREDAVLYCLSNLFGLEMIQLASIEPPQPILDMVAPEVANNYRIIPVRMDGRDLVIATADPDNLAALDDLKFMLKVEAVKPGLTSESAIDEALARYYPEKEHSALDDLMEQNTGSTASIPGSMDESFNIGSLEDLDTSDTNAAAESEPVRKLLNLILLTAVKAQASDIHFEPFEHEFRVRNRIDGVLYEMLPVPKNLAPALVARIKVMSHLDIAERRMPQDGKISVNVGSRNIDLRISTLPTMFGESVVIRVLDRSVVSLDLDKIGMSDSELEYFRQVIKRPNGIIVVTGPTGSGKTTTLYAALNEANEESVKIITTEDPVEYEIDGLVQVPIDDEIGKTFSSCLRAILRQDPDKILVGEVRDFDTAQIAIEASLTGHIVFTTLHTNDAPTAITRLVDMGLETFLIAATLQCICAQRLVRTICPKCKAPYEPADEELYGLGIKPESVKGQKFYYGKGCENCKNTGYRGRTALFEIIDIDGKVRDLILQKASASKIRIEAQRSGMTTLREAGVAKIFAGITTIEEIIRETVDVFE